MNLHFYFSSAAALTQAVMFKCSETHSALPSRWWDVVVCFFNDLVSFVHRISPERLLQG